MTANPTLDVREEPPARRHALIFETFLALAPGAGFELVNDHDPKPLYYQFAAEHEGDFTWDYLEQGPSVWRVRIGRTGVPSASARWMVTLTPSRAGGRRHRCRPASEIRRRGDSSR